MEARLVPPADLSLEGQLAGVLFILASIFRLARSVLIPGRIASTAGFNSVSRLGCIPPGFCLKRKNKEDSRS